MKLGSYRMREAMRAEDLDGALRILLEEYDLSARAGELESVKRNAGLNFSADSGLVIYFVESSIISWADPSGFYVQLGNPNMSLSAARIRSIAYKFPSIR